MPSPRTLKVELETHGYYMEIETSKDECSRERTPHWYLCSKKGREGSITVYRNWIKEPIVSREVKKEAEKLTAVYAPVICELYDHNRIHGS